MADRRRYPWADWTNGDEWKIYRNEDYSISSHNMQISLHNRAKGNDLVVSSRSFVEYSTETLNRREGLLFRFEAP